MPRLAVPAYKDYLIKTRVAEAIGLATAAKTLVFENAVNGQVLDAGWVSPSSKYVGNGVFGDGGGTGWVQHGVGNPVGISFDVELPS